MAAKRLTATEIARSTNLSRYQIDNILYGRSKNLTVLQKIATAIGVNYESLLQENFSLPTENISTKKVVESTKVINPEEYIHVISCLKEVIKEFNVQVSLQQFEEMANLLYLYKHLAPTSYEERYIAIGLILQYLKEVENNG